MGPIEQFRSIDQLEYPLVPLRFWLKLLKGEATDVLTCSSILSDFWNYLAVQSSDAAVLFDRTNLTERPYFPPLPIMRIYPCNSLTGLSLLLVCFRNPLEEFET